MRVSVASGIFASAVNAAKKGKAELTVVRCQSVVSGYQIDKIRPRLAEKLEFVAFDPLVQKSALYKEKQKVRSVPPLGHL